MKKLGALIELTQILDRNIDDGTFAKSECSEIIYVFDTNVVQMFLEPYNNPQYSEIFHSSVWGNDFPDYDLINKQACLLMGEYLLSGILPGQRGSRWYMTPEHYGELKNQLGWLEAQIKDNIERLKTDKKFLADTIEFQENLSSVLGIDPSDRDQICSVARNQGETPRELEQLFRLSDKDFADRGAGIKSRELCKVLACDEIFEPVDQLRRFRSKEIIGWLRSFELAFPPDNEGLAAIAKEQEKWDRALSETIKKRRKQYSRTDASRRHDSRTLAHLTWAVRERAKANQRIVFVTGDRALYDTYRLRVIEQSGEFPFLLRPLAQFAPLFNPASAHSSVAQREKAFGRVRGALEAAMMAFNLSLFGKGEQAALSRARDHFVLESQRPVEELKWVMLFPALSEKQRLREQNRKLSALATPLQRVEKLMLGAYPNLVARRLENRERRDLFLKSVAMTNGAGLSAALRSNLEEASSKAFMFSLPFMPQEIAKLLKTIGKDDHRLPRLLIGIRFAFPSADSSGSAGTELLTREQVIKRLTEENCDLEELLHRLAEVPARIFALAALLAFGVEDWDEAARYADLSATASRHDDYARTENTADTTTHFELLYMKATSLRFTLSSREPDPEHAYNDPWAQWLSEAEQALEECIAHHRQTNELSREIRGIAERAAVRLAYCEWYVFGGLSETRMGDEGRATALRALEAAVDDLRACYEKEGPAEARGKDPNHSGHHLSADALRWAKLQFEINTAAARLVAQELLRRSPGTKSVVEPILASLPQPKAWPETSRLQPMSRAYVFAVTGRWAELNAIKTASLTLPLDRAVIHGLQRLGAAFA